MFCGGIPPWRYHGDWGYRISSKIKGIRRTNMSSTVSGAPFHIAATTGQPLPLSLWQLFLPATLRAWFDEPGPADKYAPFRSKPNRLRANRKRKKKEEREIERMWDCNSAVIRSTAIDSRVHTLSFRLKFHERKGTMHRNNNRDTTIATIFLESTFELGAANVCIRNSLDLG